MAKNRKRKEIKWQTIDDNKLLNKEVIKYKDLSKINYGGISSLTDQ